MKWLVATVVFAGLAGMAALAQGVTPPAGAALADLASGKVLTGITLDELQKVMADAGFTATVIQSETPSVDAVAPSGYKFQAGLGDCPEGPKPRCLALNMISYEYNETNKVTLKTVNEWNRNAWGVRAMIYTNGASGIVLNVSTAGGITADWLKIQLANFDYWMGSFGKFVSGTVDEPAKTP